MEQIRKGLDYIRAAYSQLRTTRRYAEGGAVTAMSERAEWYAHAGTRWYEDGRTHLRDVGGDPTGSDISQGRT
ncbi:hypothetical protein ACE1SV_13280 [Streptomyces sennicomposti]